MSEEQSKYNHEVNPLTLTESEQLIKDEKQYINGPSDKEKANIVNMFEDKTAKVGIFELAQTLKLKNDKQKALQKEADELKSELTKEGEQLYELMIENNMPSTSFEDKTLAPVLYRTASIPEYMAEEGFKQLRDTDLESLIVERVNAQTLGAEFRRKVESGEAIKAVTKRIDGILVWVYANGSLRGQKITFPITIKEYVGEGERVWIYADGPLKGQKIAFSITEKKQIGITAISAKKKGKMKEMRGV